jgi:hypothetical protein
MTKSEQRRASETEDTLVVVPEMKELSRVQEYYSDLLLRKEIKTYKHRNPVFVTSVEITGMLNCLGYL